METPVGSVAIAGATLAQIMHDFGSVEGDSDGILFGRLQHQSTTRMQDDDDSAAGPAIAQESVTARVTGYFCSGKVQSFYDSTGRLNHSKLSSIVTERQSRGEDPLIGWFLGRRNSTLLPSMREAAVTAYLRLGCSPPPPSPAAKENEKSELESELTSVSSPKSLRKRPSLEVRQSGPVASASSTAEGSQEERMEPILPCFLVLFTESDARDNAVRTHEYRAFQSFQSAKGLSFDPLPVTIVNSGLSMRASYDSFAPVASIPSWANQELNREIGGNDATDSRQGGKSNSRRSTSRVGQDSAGAALENLLGNTESKGSIQSGGGFRVSQFEGLYEQMLTRLEMLSNEAYDSSVALRKCQEQRNPTLHK